MAGSQGTRGAVTAADPVVIRDYDPRWPQTFAALRQALAAVLGKTALTIEHVGSTAVPGLPAKPIIDMDVVVADSGSVTAAVKMLESSGYRFRGDLGVAGRYALRAPTEAVPHHLYLCPNDSAELRRHRRFRDLLRAHEPTARAYAALKRDAAQRHGNDRTAYTDAKSAFIAHVLSQAEET